MISDEDFIKGEKIDGDLNALIDRAHAKRVESGEISIKQLIDEQAERKRRRRRRENLDEWRSFHETLAANMRAEAERQEAKANALKDAEETSL